MDVSGTGVMGIFLIVLLAGADVSQMQAIMQQIDNIYEYVGLSDVEQGYIDANITTRINDFFKSPTINLLKGNFPYGSFEGYYADRKGPDEERHPGHVYIYNKSANGKILYFEIISYPYYDFDSLPDGLKRELWPQWYENFNIYTTPEPLVIYHRYQDENVPWAGDQTGLSTFLGRMVLLAKLQHITYRDPRELAEQWTNYLDRFYFDFDDLDYIYRNFPLFLENPWLWLKSGSSLNTLMELVGSGVMLNDFSFVSGDNPLFNFLSSVWEAEEYHNLWEACFNQTDAWQLVHLGDDTWVPLPFLVAYTHVLDEMGLLDLFGEPSSEIYGAYSNWSLTLNGADSQYSYEFILSSIFDSLAQSTLISSCNNPSTWNISGQNATLTTDGYSLIVNVMGNHSNTTTLSYNLTEPLNLSDYHSLLLWFNMNATRSDFSELKITLYDEENDWKEYSSWAYDTSEEWVRLTLDLDEPNSESGTFGLLANITITANPEQVLNYTFSIDDVRANSYILAECIWDTDWSNQLLSGTGNTSISVYGFPYVYDYPYSLALEWNLTESGGSASYVYDPNGAWGLNSENFLTFMLYGFGAEDQNTTLKVRLCTDGSNYLEQDMGWVDWYGWRKISLPLNLMNETGTVNYSSIDHIEFKLGEMGNGTGMLVLSDIQLDSPQWVKVEFVVPDTVLNGDGDSYPWIDLYCWNGSEWIPVGQWDADDSNSSIGYSILWNSLVYLDGTLASDLFTSQSVCMYPVGTGSQNPYSGDVGAINYTTSEDSAGLAVMLAPPAYGNMSSAMFRVEVHFDDSNNYVNTKDYPIAFFYLNSSFTNMSLKANDTGQNQYELFYGNGSSVLFLNLETAVGDKNLKEFWVEGENVSLCYGLFSSLDDWTIDSDNSTVFVMGGDQVLIQNSEHVYLNYTFSPGLDIDYDETFTDVVYSCSYSHAQNETNLTLWIEVDETWLNYTLPSIDEPMRLRIPLNGSTLTEISFEHSTNTTEDWFNIESIEVFYLTNITPYIQTSSPGYMNETYIACIGYSPRFIQTLNTTELPASCSAWAYVNGSTSLIIEFYDENNTFLGSEMVTGSGSDWYPILMIDLTVPVNATSLKYIVEAEKLDHAYLCPSILGGSGIYESFNSLKGWFIVGNGTAENNTQGLTVTLDENETLTLWTDVSVMGFDFSSFDTIAAAYNTTANMNVSIVFEWLLTDIYGNITVFQSFVELSQDSKCAVDPISKYAKIYAPIPFPYEDCVENISYTTYDLNRILLNFSGTGQANVSWVQTQYIPDWDFISVSENVTNTHLYVNWLTQSLIFGGVFNSTGGEPDWIGIMHFFEEDVNLTRDPVLEISFRTHNTSLKLGVEVLIYDELGFQWVWKKLPDSQIIYEHPIYTPTQFNVPELLMEEDGNLYTGLRAVRLYVNDTSGDFNGLGSLEINSIWLHPACGAPLSFLVLDDFEADDLSLWEKSTGWVIPYTDIDQWSSDLLTGGNYAYSPIGWQDETFQQEWFSVHDGDSSNGVLIWTPTETVTAVYTVDSSLSDSYVRHKYNLGHNNYPDSDIMKLGKSRDYLVWSAYSAYSKFQIDIPKNSTILNAYISYMCSEDETREDIDTLIYLLDQDDCADFTGSIWEWDTTGDNVAWTPPKTYAGVRYNTANISSLVQSYIDTPDYRQGYYIGFKHVCDIEFEAYKTWYQFDFNGSYNAPQLHVSYTPANYTIEKNLPNVDNKLYNWLSLRAKSSVDSTIKVALGNGDDKYHRIYSFNLTTFYQTFHVPISNGFITNCITIYYPEVDDNITVNVDYVRLTATVELNSLIENASLSENGGFETNTKSKWGWTGSLGIVTDPVVEGTYSGKITCSGTEQYLFRTIDYASDKIVRFSIYKPQEYTDQREYFFKVIDDGSENGNTIIYYLVDVFDTYVGEQSSYVKRLKWVQETEVYTDYFLDIGELFRINGFSVPSTVKVLFGVETGGSSDYMFVDDFRVYDRGESGPIGVEIDSSNKIADYQAVKLVYNFTSGNDDVCSYTLSVNRDFSGEKYIQLFVDGDNSGHILGVTLYCEDGSYGGWNRIINWEGPEELVLPLDDYDYESTKVVSGQLKEIGITIDDNPDSSTGDGYISLAGFLFGHPYNFTLTGESWSGDSAVRIQNQEGGWVRVYAESSTVGRIPFTPDELLCFAVLPSGDTPWAVFVDFSLKDENTVTLCWYRGDCPIPERYRYDFLTQVDSLPDNWNEFRLNLFDAVKNYAEMSGRSGFQYLEKVAFLVGTGEAVFDSVLIRNVPQNLDTSPLSVLSSPVIFFYDPAYPCTTGDEGNDWSLVNETFTALENALSVLNINVVWADAHETRSLISAYPRSILVIAGGIVPDTLMGREGYSVLENFVERGGTVVFLTDDQAPVSAVGREGYDTLWFRGLGLEYLLDVKSPTMELLNYSTLEPLSALVEPTDMGATLNASEVLNVSGFGWLTSYLRYQNVWVEVYYYNSSIQLGRGVCIRPRDALGFVAEFPLAPILDENYTGVVENFISDHYINLWLDTSGFNFDDYEHPLPAVSDERFVSYYAEFKAGNWTFETDLPEDEYYASAQFAASWRLFMNATLNDSRDDSIVANHTVDVNSSISIAGFPFFTATLVTIGNYTKLKLEVEVSGTWYTLFDDNCTDWRKYVWYLPNTVGGSEDHLTGVKVTLYENSTSGVGNASVSITDMGAYTIGVPEYGLPKALDLDFENATGYDYLFAGGEDYPVMGLKFNDTENSVYTITRDYAFPFSFLDYPYLEVALSGTGGNYTAELWLQKKYNSENYTWIQLDSFNFSDTGSLRHVIGYNLYAQFNAYSEFFNPDTADIRAWRIIVRGNASEVDAKTCVFSVRYVALTDYFTCWSIYPGGDLYSGGDGYVGGAVGLEEFTGESLNETGEIGLVEESTVSESFKPSQVDVSESVSLEDYCLSTESWEIYNKSGGADAKIVSISEHIELRLMDAGAGDWAIFRYCLGGINVSQTNYLDLRFRVRPEVEEKLVVYAEVSDNLVKLEEFYPNDLWITRRLDVLSALVEAGVSSVLVTGLVFELVREEGSGRYDCYADIDSLRFSGSASWKGSLSTLFFDDEIPSVFKFTSVQGATLVYNIPTGYHDYNLAFKLRYLLESDCLGVNVYFYNWSSGKMVKTTTLNTTDSWETLSESIYGCFVRHYDGRFLVYLEPLCPEGVVSVNLKVDWAEVQASTSTENFFLLSGMGLDSLPTDLDGVFDQLGSELVWFGEDYYHRRVAYWLEGWNYRKPITVTYSGELDNLTFFQVMVPLQGNNPGGDGYVDFSRVALGGSDIRFTAYDGLTLVDFWVESWNDTSQEAVVWIECPLLRVNETTIFYMYYDCAGAESISSGDSTFLFFDDFLGSSLGDSWNPNGNVSVADSVCTIGGGTVESMIESVAVYGPGIIVQSRARVNDTWGEPIVTKNYSVAASLDDTWTKYNYQMGSSNHPSDTVLQGPGYYTAYLKKQYCYVYVRLQLDIPTGSEIKEAYLYFKSQTTQGTSIPSYVQLLNFDNCPDFDENPYTWSTTGSVDWTVPATTQNNWYHTPDIKSLVQDYVDRSGYSPGVTYAGFKVRGHDEPNAVKDWYSWDDLGTGNEPYLYVKYTPPFDLNNLSATLSLYEYNGSVLGDLISVGRLDGYPFAGDWSCVAQDGDYFAQESTGWDTDISWHTFRIDWIGDNESKIWIDSNLFDGFLGEPAVPSGDPCLGIMHHANGAQRPNTALCVDYTFVRKYAAQMPAVGYGEEQTPPDSGFSFYELVDMVSGSEMVHFYWHMLENVSSIDDYYLEFRLRNDVGAVFDSNVQGEPNALISLYKEFMLSLCGVVEPPEDYVGDYSDLNMTVRILVQYYDEENAPLDMTQFYEEIITYSENGDWYNYTLDIPGGAPEGAYSWSPIIRAVGCLEGSFVHLFIDDVKCPKTYQTSATDTGAEIVVVNEHGHVLNCSNTSDVEKTIWWEYLNIPFSPDLLFNFDVYPVSGDWWLGLKFRVQLYDFLTSYNASINVSSSVDYVGPVDVFLTFDNESCYEGSLFVLDVNGTHVPFAVKEQCVSDDYVLNMTLSILVNITEGETQTFKIFYSDFNNPLPELVSPTVEVVDWTDDTQNKTVTVNCSATDLNLSRVILHCYNGSWYEKDMVLDDGFYVENFNYTDSYQFYCQALDNRSNSMRTWTYPGDAPSLDVDVGESEIYLRERYPAGYDSVELYYSDGAEKYVGSAEDSMTYGYVLECGEGWNHFLRLPYADLYELFVMRYESLPTWEPLVLERIMGGGLNGSCYLLDDLKWGLYPRTVLDYSGNDAMNFYFSYDPDIPVVKVVGPRVFNGMALFNACCSDINTGVLDEVNGSIASVMFTISNSTDVVYSSYMEKQHPNNETYACTDFWFAYLDTTQFPDGFYDLNVTAWDNSGNRADDIVNIIIHNEVPEVEFLYPSNDDGVGARVRVVVRTYDLFDMVSANLTVYDEQANTSTVYGMQEGYFQHQNQWNYNLVFEQSGNYTLSVNATNYYGISSETVSINITVDTTIPSANVTAPMDYAWVTGEAVDLSVEATDDNGIGSVQWRVYVVNNMTGELEIPTGYLDAWDTADYAGGDLYTDTWNTSTLIPEEALYHSYVIRFKINDNNTSPNSVYRNVPVLVDNNLPQIDGEIKIVSQNNVDGKDEEGFTSEGNATCNQTAIYTKYDNAWLTFHIQDLRQALYYDIEESDSYKLDYRESFNISIIDEFDGGSFIYSQIDRNFTKDNNDPGFFVFDGFTLVNGSHNVTLTVSDPVGNSVSVTKRVDIVVDTTPPIVIPILPTDGMWIKRVINNNGLWNILDPLVSWLLTFNMMGGCLPDRIPEGVLFGVYVDDRVKIGDVEVPHSPILTNTIYMNLSNRGKLDKLGPMSDSFVDFLWMMDEAPNDWWLSQGSRNMVGGMYFLMQAFNESKPFEYRFETLYAALAGSGYIDLGLGVLELLYGDKVYWYGVDFYPVDFLLDSIIMRLFFMLLGYSNMMLYHSGLYPKMFTANFMAWDKAGNKGTASSTFGIYPVASVYEMPITCDYIFGLYALNRYIEAISGQIADFTAGGGYSQGGASQFSSGETGFEPLSSGGVTKGLEAVPSGDSGSDGGVYGVFGGGESSGEDVDWLPVLSVEQTLSYEFYENVTFLPWMRFSFRVFGAPIDISLNVRFGEAECIRLFFDSMSYQTYGHVNDSLLLYATPDVWNSFTLPLWELAAQRGLFRGFNAPTKITSISVCAYGEREVWERRAVMDDFNLATPVPLCEEYAKAAAKARDMYYQLINVNKSSNLEFLKQDIFDIFATAYLDDLPQLAQVLENYSLHLFPNGELAEISDADIKIINDSSNAPLFLVYSWPGGLENVSILAAYDYVNIPNVDLSSVLEANITDLCRELAETGWMYGLSDKDMAYLPYGCASFIIINDTVCVDRLTARPCTIQTVIATLAAIAERLWSHKCVQKAVEMSEVAQQIQAMQAYLNESAYKYEALSRLESALQWVNYMHPYNWDMKNFHTLINESGPYWSSYNYAGELNYSALGECLANITLMLDFGDQFGAPPLFICTGSWNTSDEETIDECLLICEALEYDENDVGASVLFVVVNDTYVINVAKKFGRCENATLADVYMYMAEMVFMYTVPYNSEQFENQYNMMLEALSAMMMGPLGTLSTAAQGIYDLVDYFTDIPLINLLNTLDSLFLQKFNKICETLGIPNYVEWLNEPYEYYYDGEVYNDTYEENETLTNPFSLITTPLATAIANHLRPYKNVLDLQKEILGAGETTFLWPEGRDDKRNPVLNVKATWEGYGLESQTFLSVPALIYRMLLTFRSRTSASGTEQQGSSSTRAILANFIGNYARERANVITVPGIGVEHTIRQYIFDSVGLFYDPTSTIIAYLDDYERITAQVYMGVDCEFSVISSDDYPGGYLSQSITIRNDPASMYVRKTLLEQTDEEGNRLLNKEWLVRMGWAYYDGDNIVKLIKPDGQITGVIIHEMGFDETTGKPKCIINIADAGGEPTHDIFEQGVVYKQTSQNGHISSLEIVYKDLSHIDPIIRDNGKLEIGGRNENMFHPWVRDRGDDKDINTQVLYFKGILNNLMRIFGVQDYCKVCIITQIDNAPRYQRIPKCVEFILSFLSPDSQKLPWSEFKGVYEEVARKSLEVKTSLDRQWSDRVALLSLLGDSIISKDGGLHKYFVSINISPELLSARNHPLTGFARANTPFFRIPEGELPPFQPGIDPEDFDPKKATIAFFDYVESISSGKVIVVVPVFKDDSKYRQDVDPDEFNYRVASSSPVSVVSKENELWSNVGSFLKYEYSDGKYTIVTKPFAMSNEYFKNEYTPTSIRELGMFLTLLSRTFQATTSYEDPDRKGQYKNPYMVSPKDLCDQLESMLYTFPIQAIGICKELGILDALTQLREIKPIQPYSNQAAEGWFYHSSKDKKAISNNPDSCRYLPLNGRLQYIPTSTDLYIALLSIVGFQRMDLGKRVILPINTISEESSDTPYKYEIGSTQFYLHDDGEIEKLDSIGVPVDDTGKVFRTPPNKNPLKFSELSYEQKALVRGINLNPVITPYEFREVFHGRISGVPFPNQFSQIFEKMTKWRVIETGTKDKTGYYEFCEWILDYLGLDSGNRQGHERAQFISDAVRNFVTNPVYKIMELRDNLADEEFVPVLGIIDTYFLVEAYSQDSEPKALKWFGNFYSELKDSIDKGNVFEIVSGGFEQALKYIAQKLENNPSFEIQGRMLRAMIKLGNNLDTIAEIRPETALFAAPKAMFLKSLIQNYNLRMETIKKEVDAGLWNQLQLGTDNGQKYVMQEYAMQLVAYLKYQGWSIDDIVKEAGLEKDKVEDLLGRWDKYCQENNLNEIQQQKAEAAKLLDKICQGPTIKSLKDMFSPMNLICTGGQMAIGGAIGSAHVAPFITIVAPVLQAIGYTLVAALEACTLSPIYNFSNPDLDFTDPENYYYGGCITWNMMNPDTNIALAILLAAGVYLTDYMEFGCGAFQGVRCGIDMDWVNVILAGMQGGMMTLGMGYVSEDTLADLMKPFLAVFGALAGMQYGGPIGALIGLGAGGAVGVVSMLPQVDQFYKEYIWPAAKLMIGTSLMGKVTTVLTSAIANMAAMTGINAVENAWVNNVMGLPWMQDATLDFGAVLEYLPGGSLGYDYLANYITHYVYGMW